MMNHFDGATGAQREPAEPFYVPREPRIEWTPVEVIEAQWEKLTAPRREQERLEAERREAEARRQAQIAKLKDALPYLDAHAQEICERIAIGELLLNICLDEHLPSLRRAHQWLNEYPEFKQLYNSAIQDRLDVFSEEVIRIADDMQHDFRTVIKNDREKRVADPY